MLSLVLRIAIALVLCSQVFSLHNSNIYKNSEGKSVRFVEDKTKIEVTNYYNEIKNNNKSNYKEGYDDRKDDYLKRKSYEEEDNNEGFGRGIKDTNSLLPEFSIPIGNVTATLGRDTRLICTIEHLGRYQVAWLRVETNTILSIDTNIITSNYRMFLIPDEEERKWVLHIKDVQVSDRGMYQCQVNTIPVRSIVGYLDVLVPPTVIETQTSQAVDVIEHWDAVIQCKADGHPKANISWCRDDGSPIKLKGIGSSNGDNKQLEMQSMISIEAPLYEISSETLNLQQVDRSMAGVYVCIASNGIATQANKRIPLYVRFPPKASVQISNSTIPPGDQFEVDCTIEAFPKASNFWFRKLERTRNQVPKKESLILPSNKLSNPTVGLLQPNDDANFARQARQSSYSNTVSLIDYNSQNARDQSSNALLINPIFENATAATTKAIKMKEFQGAEFVPIINSARTIVRQTVINSYTYKLKLTFTKMTPDDYGEYLCISSNPLGNSTTSFALLMASNERSKLPTQTTIDPRQKHQAESNESNLYPHSVKVVPKFGKIVNQKTSIRRNGNHIYDENYLQTIKSRHGNGSRAVKLKHRGDKNSAANRKSSSNLYLSPFLVTIFLLLSRSSQDNCSEI